MSDKPHTTTQNATSSPKDVVDVQVLAFKDRLEQCLDNVKSALATEADTEIGFADMQALFAEAVLLKRSEAQRYALKLRPIYSDKPTPRIDAEKLVGLIESWKADQPPTLAESKGLDRATIKKLIRAHGLDTVGKLESFLDSGQRLDEIPGIDQAQAKKIKQALKEHAKRVEQAAKKRAELLKQAADNEPEEPQLDDECGTWGFRDVVKIDDALDHPTSRVRKLAVQIKELIHHVEEYGRFLYRRENSPFREGYESWDANDLDHRVQCAAQLLKIMLPLARGIGSELQYGLVDQGPVTATRLISALTKLKDVFEGLVNLPVLGAASEFDRAMQFNGPFVKWWERIRDELQDLAHTLRVVELPPEAEAVVEADGVALDLLDHPQKQAPASTQAEGQGDGDETKAMIEKESTHSTPAAISWARNCELIRATNTTFGKNTLNAGTISQACKPDGLERVEINRIGFISVSGFLHWVSVKLENPSKDEMENLHNGIMGQIRTRKPSIQAPSHAPSHAH